MLAYGYSHPHPFAVNNEVLVDMTYYASYEIARGDIVVFRTKDQKEQETDIARVVGSCYNA